MDEILKYAVMTVSVGISAFSTVWLAVIIIARLREQKKLYSSIQLIQLKSFKLHSLVFAVLGVAMLLYLVGQTLDSASPERKFFVNSMGFTPAQFVVTSVFVEVFLLMLSLFFTVCALSKCAVVDKGIYTGYGFIGWSEIYDYVVDERSCKAIFTVNRESFSTMRGTTPPYRVVPEDVSKLVFILNRNKNRFN